ncbi:MAG: biotin/lipoyl-containing protein [Ignavibacteria bacterium]
MKKYFISLPFSNSQKELVLIDEKNLIFNEKQYIFEYIRIYDNVFVFRINNQNYTVAVENTEEEEQVKNTNFVVEINGMSYNVKCQSEMDILVENFSKSKGTERVKTDIVAPMPGSIVKVGVQEGQLVKKGQVLVVLEAMKMENELKAPIDCMVKKVFVEEKQAVEKNQLLIKLEPLQ